MTGNLTDFCRLLFSGPAAQDRFAPGEAYHATVFKLKQKKKQQQQQGYRYNPPKVSREYFNELY